MKCCGLGDLRVTKQTTLLHRCIWYVQIVFLYFRYGFDGQDPVHVSWNEMHVWVKILTSFFPRIATSTHWVSWNFF